MQKGCVVWLTGLPGSGKTTIARALEKRLMERGTPVEVLDGDEVRENLSPHLGFSREDREVHANRVAYVSRLLARNGVIAIVGLISPYREFRRRARAMAGDFVEVYVSQAFSARSSTLRIPSRVLDGRYPARFIPIAKIQSAH